MKPLPTAPLGSSVLPRAIALLALAIAAGCGRPRVSPTGGGGGATSTGPGPGAGGTTPGAGIALPGSDAGPAGGTRPGPGPDERACAENVTRAMQVPVDLLLLVDASRSMLNPATPGGSTKWSLAIEALQRFVRDPRSAGMGMGLQFFPIPAHMPCSVDSDCPAIPGVSPRCLEFTACVGSTVRMPSPSTCSIAQPSIAQPLRGCLPGETCTPAGACAITRRDCVPDGQPCPGGIPDDICRAIPGGKICTPTGLNCEEADYERLIVPIADLPGNELRLTAVLAAQLPSGGTPTGTAVKGVMAHLRERLLAHPERKVALVLATDGLPGGCPGSDVSSIAGDLAAARMGNPSIPTYAIGVFDPRELAQGQPALEAFATAGGTGMPFVIEAASDLTARLQDALVQIRGSVLPCEFVIPPPVSGTRIDYGKVNLKWKGTSTPEETVGYVERADRCDPTRGGWYYDVPPAAGTPSRVIACEATCRQLNGDYNATVSLTFGCATRVIE